MPISAALTTFVRHASCPPNQTKIDYFDVAMRGFMLEVRASGGKTYYQRYTDERGRERQFKIGPADALTLQQARRKAKQIKAEAILGGDPQQARQVRRSIPTLRWFVDERYLRSSKATSEVGKQTKRFCVSTYFRSWGAIFSTKSDQSASSRSQTKCAVKGMHPALWPASSSFCGTCSTWRANGTCSCTERTQPGNTSAA